jgi:hypothetical protein
MGRVKGVVHEVIYNRLLGINYSCGQARIGLHREINLPPQGRHPVSTNTIGSHTSVITFKIFLDSKQKEIFRTFLFAVEEDLACYKTGV